MQKMERASIMAKQKRAGALSALIKENPVVCILDMKSLPSRQLHDIKQRMIGKAIIRMAKRSTLERALEAAGRSELAAKLQGQPALLLSKENPFKLYKILEKNRSQARAKAGDIAPKDITVSAGMTEMAPGPAMGMLKKFGLQTKVTGGKLEITADRVVAKTGDVITAELAGLFGQLGIEPMQVGLNLIIAYENGTIYQKDVLAVSDEEYIERIQQAYNHAFNLAFHAQIFMPENVEAFVKKAVLSAKSVASEAKFEAQA